MIKLIKEAQANTALAKLSPEELKQYKQALNILQDDETLDESIKDSLKKLGLSAAVIAALLLSPQLSPAQKAAVSNLKGQTTMTTTTSTTKTNPNFWVKDTNDIKSVQKVIKAYRLYSIEQWKAGKNEIEMSGTTVDPNKPEDVKRVEKNYMLWCLGTSEDGKNGQYTSQFEFPGAFLKDLNSGKVQNLGLKGNESLSLINSSGLTVQQMAEWNNYVKWMKDKGYSGKEDMDHASFRDNVLQQYKGQVKENKMTNHQLREAIRRIINQELNEATYPKAGEKGYVKVSSLKKGDILGGSNLEVISVSAGAKTPSGKIEVTVKDPKTGKEITKTWGKTTIVKVKDKTNENAPAPSKPATSPGVKEPPAKTPGKKEPRRPLGNPNVKPAPKAKATMKEAEMLKQVIKRFKSKKNA